MTDEEAAAVFERLPALVNGDIPLVRRGRFLTTTFLIGAGDIPVLGTVREGAVTDVTVSPPPMRSWRFAVRAGADAWRRFWQAEPEPGYHDLLAMTRFGAARIEGDLHPLMANLRYIKEVLEAPRRAGLGEGDGDAG